MAARDEAIDYERDVDTAPAPLPRGRHKLSAEAVRASQRERLLRAMLESVAERGYESTTVPEVVARARVSRNAFYELFEEKLDCFLALCEEQSKQLLGEVFQPMPGVDWLDATRAGARRYLAWWQARPRFSRAFLMELPTAGTRAIEQRERAFRRFVEQFELLAAWARQQHPDLAPVRPLAARFIVSAITDVVVTEIAAGRVSELPLLEDELMWLITRLIAEPGGA